MNKKIIIFLVGSFDAKYKHIYHEHRSKTSPFAWIVKKKLINFFFIQYSRERERERNFSSLLKVPRNGTYRTWVPSNKSSDFLSLSISPFLCILLNYSIEQCVYCALRGRTNELRNEKKNTTTNNENKKFRVCCFPLFRFWFKKLIECARANTHTHTFSARNVHVDDKLNASKCAYSTKSCLVFIWIYFFRSLALSLSLFYSYFSNSIFQYFKIFGCIVCKILIS